MTQKHDTPAPAPTTPDQPRPGPRKRSDFRFTDWAAL